MAMEYQKGIIAVLQPDCINKMGRELITSVARKLRIMVTNSFPEKSVALEGAEQSIECSPFRSNAVKRKLEELLNIAVEQQTVTLRMVIA